MKQRAAARNAHSRPSSPPVLTAWALLLRAAWRACGGSGLALRPWLSTRWRTAARWGAPRTPALPCLPALLPSLVLRGCRNSFPAAASVWSRPAAPPSPQVWHLLSWRGRHSQAPVAVAQRPHYFCELDVPRTLRHLIR